jgi:hypothetical protein
MRALESGFSDVPPVVWAITGMLSQSTHAKAEGSSEKTLRNAKAGFVMAVDSYL